MFGLKDVYTIEGADDQCSELEYYASLQRAINSGMWGLQGSYGRAMMDAIQDGYCMLGTTGARDYYGNYIPSRTEVREGTPGSYDNVCNASGVEWADEMANV